MGLSPCLDLYATDHNEPELLSAFYSDVNGSGADIYGLFGYPTEDGLFLNVILTIAPIPSTGIFDPNTVHRIYLMPGRVLAVEAQEVINEIVDPKWDGILFSAFSESVALLAKPILPGLIPKSTFEKRIIQPIVESAAQLFDLGINGNNLPIDQKSFPEIIAVYNTKGTWANITFKNFYLNGPTDRVGNATLLAKSNGIETDPNKLKLYNFHDIEAFVGGRDDPFFSDIAGFFRSINFAAALEIDEVNQKTGEPSKKDDFRWKGRISRRASAENKEQDGRIKHLIDRRAATGVYNGQDWRAGNNVNTLAFKIPVKYIIGNHPEHRLVRMWAEGFVTEETYHQLVNRH